jgi:hypothetical protein
VALRHADAEERDKDAEFVVKLVRELLQEMDARANG